MYRHTVKFCAGMNDAARGMSEHGMHYTILLAQMSLVVFSLLDIVYLHTVVTFRGEKKSPFVIKVDRKNGALNRRWSPWSKGISTEVLLPVRLALFHVPKEILLPL
jgi:hypothetical protein